MGVLVMMLIGGGGAYAYWNHKQNRPAPIWVPFPINPELPDGKRDEVVKELDTRLHAKELLAKVSQDLSLRGKWRMTTDGDAVDELSRRVFVKAGDMDTPMGKVPAIHVGANGVYKERELSGKIAVRLMDDVAKILGIQPPPKGKPGS